MRAIEPVEAGFVERAGARVGYEVFGQEGRPTLLLMPTFAIVHSRVWKMQVPYLARHYRVITWDRVGNGRSDRPAEAARYSAEEHAADALAILDATATDRVVVIGSSMGAHRALHLTQAREGLVDGLLILGPKTPLGSESSAEIAEAFLSRDHDRFVDVFLHAVFSEPHSSKAIEDGIGWAHETDMPTFRNALQGDQPDPEDFRRLAASVQCPVLVVQGTEDAITPEDHGRRLVEAIGANASLLLMEGSGHGPSGRDCVHVSLVVRDFVERIHPQPVPKQRTWTRAMSRRRRALFLSSPVGLGHTRRDIAIAQELRQLHPDLQIDWLSADPVIRALDSAGERVHPASAWRVSESAHFEAEAHGHDLHAFQAMRRMDEVAARNFMVLHDVLADDTYDLVVADEAGEVDFFLHENPELKTTAYAG